MTPSESVLYSVRPGEQLNEATVSLTHADSDWGTPTHLGGLLSSVCVFVDTLPPTAAKTIAQYGMGVWLSSVALNNTVCLSVCLYVGPNNLSLSVCLYVGPNNLSLSVCLYVGPNNLSLYQPKCSLTHELSSKLLFYYHPKVRREPAQQEKGHLPTGLS